MFKLDSNGGLIFKAEDLREVYEPIVAEFGFEYDEFLDRRKKGLVWSKCYESDYLSPDLWPLMIIRETGADICPSSREASYFSTSLWWGDSWGEGLTLGVNPNEFEDDDSGDEIELFVKYARYAQKKVNDVLEKCRQKLVARLSEIEAKLAAEAAEE